MAEEKIDTLTNGATEHLYNLSSFFQKCHDLNDRILLWLEDGKALAAEREDLVENSRRYGAMKKQTDEALAKLSLAPAKVKKVKTVEAAPLIDYINAADQVGAHD